MEHGPITLQREQAARLLGGGIRFFLGAALTASQTAGGYAPFALGLVAAAGPGLGGAAALAGTGVGALLFMEFAQALPHLAIAVLILTAATAFRGSSTLARPKVLALTAGGLSQAVWGIYVIQSLAPLEKLTPCRRVRTTDILFSPQAHSVARPGYRFPEASILIRVSYTLRMIRVEATL